MKNNKTHLKGTKKFKKKINFMFFEIQGLFQIHKFFMTCKMQVWCNVYGV
jgi:hypothetical protein